MFVVELLKEESDCVIDVLIDKRLGLPRAPQRAAFDRIGSCNADIENTITTHNCDTA